jgi:hypothetical protein
MKISFINAVATICESVGAKVDDVRDGIGTDTRIGKRFLYPGIGYGGSCFPKDLSAYRAVAHGCGYDFRLLEEVMRINDGQQQRFLHKVRKALWTIKGKRAGVLGLAFKGGTDDVRESPAPGDYRVSGRRRMRNSGLRSGCRPTCTGGAWNQRRALRGFRVRSGGECRRAAAVGRVGRV